MLDDLFVRLCAGYLLKLPLNKYCPSICSWLKDSLARQSCNEAKNNPSPVSDSFKEDPFPFRIYVQDLLFGEVQTAWSWMETVFGLEPTEFKFSCPDCGSVLRCIPKKDLSYFPIRMQQTGVYPPPHEYTKLHCANCKKVVHKHYGTELEMEQEFKKEILSKVDSGDWKLERTLAG